MSQPPQDPYQPQPGWPQPPDLGQQPGPLPPSRRAKAPWPIRHKVLSSIIAAVALFAAAGIGAAGAAGKSSAAAAPAATMTMIQHDPGATVTVTATPTATVTVSVTPTANAQGEATQISADGVYVVGQDIPGGTWHTSGGSQCYEATLGSTDTSNILDNNNFTGPDTVSLAGAAAFDISGGCTWQQEG
jgi:hypothetical protein